MKTKQIILLLIILNLNSALQADSFFEKRHYTSFFDFFSWPWNKPTEDDDEEDEVPVEPTNPFTPEKLINLKWQLQERIIGQDRAIDAVVSVLDNYTLGLHDPN